LSLGRKFIGCEADAGHIELSIKRLSNPVSIELPTISRQGHLWKE